MRSLSWSLWVVSALLVVSVSLQLPRMVYRFIPPYEVIDAWIETPQVRRGDLIVVGYRAIRKRVCRLDVDHNVFSESNGLVIIHQRSPIGTQVVDQVVEFRLDGMRVFDKVKAGRYVVAATFTSECTEVMHVVNAPLVKFTVIE